MIRTQRSVILGINGCYRTSSNEKLLGLLKINAIDEELKIKNAVNELDKKGIKNAVKKLLSLLGVVLFARET